MYSVVIALVLSLVPATTQTSEEVVDLFDTVEIGLAEVSPLGPDGGYAVPASGCSYTGHGTVHECTGPDITADPPIVRYDGEVEICWDPGGYLSGCTLSDNLTGNGNSAACETVTLVSESTFDINCGTDTSSVTVLVLPQVEET